MRNLIVLAAFVIVAACTPAPTPSPSEPVLATTPVAPAPTPAVEQSPTATQIADEASCGTAGGEWRPICRMQKPACVITYKDAGKSCTDGSQCEGDCLGETVSGAAAAGSPATGKCSTNSDPCGCRTLISDGKAAATLCAD